MNRNIFCTILFSASLIFMASCRKSLQYDEIENTPQTVKFKIDGAGTLQDIKVNSRMAEGESASDGEIQTNLEKQVNSLTAVIFKDAVAGGLEDNTNDIFFKTVDIDLSGAQNQIFENLTFSVGAEGNYIVAFVANADTDLKGKLKALTPETSTVQDFKDIEIVQAPETKPAAAGDTGQGMIMTSQFYAFKSSFVESANLGVVYLRRIMSRIDIVNYADEVTITKVDFHNRTIKSSLYNDDKLQVETGNLGTTLTMEPLTLVGSQTEPARYEAEIYSYEQLADETQTDYQPSLDIYYTLGENNYKHTVDLKVPKSKDNATLVPIGLKRNNAYIINLRIDAGDIKFIIEVADWVEGEKFVVTDKELIDNALGFPNEPGTVTGQWESEGSEEITTTD